MIRHDYQLGCKLFLPRKYGLKYCYFSIVIEKVITQILSFKKENNMEEAIKNLKKQFLTLSRDVLKKIHKDRIERWVVLKSSCLLKDICQIIEAKVRLAGEFSNSLLKRMLGMGRSTYSKKRKAKRMNVCHKCAR